MTSWPIFHGPLTSDFGQIIKVKIVVQGRIFSSTNGSKLIFHIRTYFYETSRNIQEPWPHDLYFTVCSIQTLVNFPWLRFLSWVSLLMVASWSLPLWDQQGLLPFQGFMLRDGARGQHLGHYRFCLSSWMNILLVIWFSGTQTLIWIYICMSVTYISWYNDFALYLEDYLIDKCYNWDIGSMWCKDLPH